MLELRDASGRDEPWLKHLFSVSHPAVEALASLPDGVGEGLVTMQYAARQAHFRAHWPRAVQRVIHLRAGDEPDRAFHWQAVGALSIDDGVQGIHVLDVAVLPAWRGQGVATCCLQELLEAAERRQLPVTLQVATFSPARRLYERLGFVPAGADDGVNLPMICPPPRARTRDAGTRSLAGKGLSASSRASADPHPTETCNEQA